MKARAMEAVEVPQYFACPISLQIMKDPVTTVTGITYDRSSIERWLYSDHNTTCPVTNQPLPRDSDVTPNHTLRRLIQAWCTINSLDRIPTPRAPVDRTAALSLLCDLSHHNLQLNSLSLISSLASDNESNRRTLLQASAAKFIIRTIVSCACARRFDRVELALNLMQSLRVPDDQLRPLVADNYDLVDALTPILQHESTSSLVSATTLALRSFVEMGSSSLLERLKVDFFQGVVRTVRIRITPQVTKAALHVLLSTSPWGRNRAKIVETGAVHELIELELTGPDKRRTELVMGLLDHLCACADGRAKMVEHTAGLAVVAKRILRVSQAADEGAVGVLWSVCKYLATSDVVVQEMLGVGAVSKLCFMLQAECSSGAREKARWVLRLHAAGAWKNSSCINSQLLTSCP